MSARDELAKVIVAAYGEDAETECPCEQDLDVADAILAAGYRKPRTITSAEELDALPNGTVVIANGTSHHSGGWSLAYQRWEDGAWHRGARSGSTDPGWIVPATVLHEPTP